MTHTCVEVRLPSPRPPTQRRPDAERGAPRADEPLLGSLAAGRPAALPLPAPPRRRQARQVLTAVVTAAVLALVASQWSLFSGAVAALAHLDWRWVALLVASEVASKAAVARTHQRLLRAGGTRLAHRPVLAVVYAGNALSMTLPVVGAELAAAFNYRQFRLRGASQAAAGWTMLVSGVAATSAFAALVGVGTALTGTGWRALLGAGGAALAALPGWVLVVLLRRPGARRQLIHMLRRLPARLPGPVQRPARRVAGAGAPLLDSLGALQLSGAGWAAVLALALTNWLVDCLGLAAAIAATGAHVPWPGLLLAFLAGAGANTLALTPGGLGTVEVTFTAALVAAGLPAQPALTAVLVYRLVTLWLATSGGWAAYAVLTRSRRATPAVVHAPTCTDPQR